MPVPLSVFIDNGWALDIDISQIEETVTSDFEFTGTDLIDYTYSDYKEEAPYLSIVYDD